MNNCSAHCTIPSNLDIALRYLAKGWSVVPVADDKRPLVDWKPFQVTHPSEALLHEWYHKWPDAGIAVVTGAVSRLNILDVDPRHGGIDSIAGQPPLPKCPTSKTGGGGQHYFFSSDGALPSKTALLPGVDFLGEGHIAVLPPSKHPSGAHYRWEEDYSIEDISPPPLPDWIKRLVVEEPMLLKERQVELGWVAQQLQGVSQGQRHQVMKQLVGHFLARGLPPSEVAAIVRAWNERNMPPLPESELSTQLSDMVSRWAPAPLTYSELQSLFSKWLLIKDQDALRLSMAVVASHLLPGDPVWLFLIAPPSGTKTEIILSLGDLPFVRYLPDINARTFASGERGATDVSLLAHLTEALLTIKDFTTVLAKRWEERQEILSQLREIYDGRFEKRWGSGKQLRWQGRLSLVAGVTPVIDTHHAVMQVLGERFLQLRLASPNRIKMATKAIEHVGNEDVMRSELKAGVKAFFSTLEVPKSMPVSSKFISRLSALSDFVTRARSGVVRDSYRRDLLLAPEPEAPARLAKQIYRVLQGLAAIVGSGEPTEQDYNLIYRLALDCIPKIRTQCLELLNNSGELETPKVASEIAYPTSTTRLSLEELHRMGLVAVVKEGHGKADRWSLSDLACQLLEDCAPEVIESKTG